MLSKLMKWFMKSSSSQLTSQEIVYREVADEDDFFFIINRCIAEAQGGHFSKIYASKDPLIQGGLQQQILCAVSDRPYPLEPGNPRNGTGAKTFIIEKNKERMGFILLLEDMPGSWREKVELHLFSILPEYRGKGLGRRVVQDVLTFTPAREVYARCYAKSTTMINLLMQLGFKLKKTSTQGTKTLTLKR